MKTEDRVRARLEAYKNDPEYQAERLSILITAEIVRLMESENVSRTELAARMGVSKALISRLLGGTPNMTLRTLATIAVALESEISIKLREWKDSVSVRGESEGTATTTAFSECWGTFENARANASTRADFHIVRTEEGSRESRTAA